MKINFVLLALSIALVNGSHDPSFKARFHKKVADFKDAIHGLKKATHEAVKSHKGSKGNHVKADHHAPPIAPPTTTCHMVEDEVWQEECTTKFNNSCRMEKKPVCHTISAKECSPEPKESCKWIMENKCKTISVPSCSIDWEQRCTSDPICTTVQRKQCNNVEKDVCVEHMDKICTMSMVKVCRKTAVRGEVEDGPEDEEEVHVKAKGKGVSHNVHNKSKFKHGILDKIEEHTDKKVDHIAEKLMGLKTKGDAHVASKGHIVKRHTDEWQAAGVSHNVHKAKFKHGILDKIEEHTDKKVDHIAEKLMGLKTKGDAHVASKGHIVKRHTDEWQAAKAEKKAAIKAAKAQFKAAVWGHKGKDKGKHVGPSMKLKFVKTCEEEPRKTCKSLPRTVCHKETVPVCTREPEESCVEKETCKSWPKKNCEMVHKETCWPFPTKKCTEVTTEVCKLVPRENCVDKVHEICESIPVKDCQKNLVKKPRQVCIPLPTIRTEEDW